MDIQLLTQADFVLNKCGRPVAPSGLAHVYIPKGFIVQNVFAATPTTPQNTITKEITGDTTWCMRGISMTSSPTTSINLQVQLPDGRFLTNILQDALQIAGYGSYRYAFSRELRCPPGSKIQVALADTDTSISQPIAILFEGAYDYLLKSGYGRICPADEIAAQLPRIFAGPNQNIEAPCWMHGVGSKTPDGWQDEIFTYGGAFETVSFDVAAGPFTGIQQIPIDANSDFKCRRVLVLIEADDTVTAGIILARVRLGSGYALTDDYIDIARYIGSAPFAKTWDLPAGDSVFLDLQLVDQTGTGNISITTYLDGVKRRKAA